VDSNNSEPSNSPDLISTVATVGAPTYVLLRLLTGGWTFALFFTAVVILVSVFYWFVVLPDSEEKP
jgi:hypothetical protein